MTIETIIIESETNAPLFEIKREYGDRQGHRMRITSLTDFDSTYEAAYDYGSSERVFTAEKEPTGFTPQFLDILMDMPTRLTIKDILWTVEDGKRFLDIVERSLDELLNRPTRF